MFTANRMQLLHGANGYLALPFLPSLTQPVSSSQVRQKTKKAIFINMGNGLLAKSVFSEKAHGNVLPYTLIESKITLRENT